MKFDGSCIEKAAPPHAMVAATRTAQKPSAHTIGTTTTAAAKELLAFVFRSLQRRSVGKSRGRSGLDRHNDADMLPRWIVLNVPLVLPATHSRTVFCDVGTVWITQGDNNDFVLSAGEKLQLHPLDTLVVTAMAGSALIRYSR